MDTISKYYNILKFKDLELLLEHKLYRGMWSIYKIVDTKLEDAFHKEKHFQKPSQSQITIISI